MIHIKKRVKNFLLILICLIEIGVTPSLIACEQQFFSFNHLTNILIIPAIQFGASIVFRIDIIELKTLKFKIELIFNKLFHPLHIDFIEFRNETSTDESVFEAQSDFFAIGEDELIQIVENELE